MEAKNLINVLTTNHTYFMRESIHFDYMRKMILPQLKVKEANTKDLRIWPAASSTGEEPYGIAMVLKDYFALEHSQWDTTDGISNRFIHESFRTCSKRCLSKRADRTTARQMEKYLFQTDR